MTAKIKFQFDPDQEYQLRAVESVMDLFEGVGAFAPEFSLGDEIKANLPNDEMLFESEILTNLQVVQERNGLAPSFELEKEGGMVLEGIGIDSVDFPQFTVEMETGTGKTYVYLRTIYQLNQKYGFTKFIIIVPSIAIYEGVFKADQMTRSHFASLYGNNTINLIPYEGARVGQVRNFATSETVQVLLMTIDAFNKTSNNIYKTTDKLQGTNLRPFEFVSHTRPIIIIDEPQSIDTTEKAKSAIRTLNPLFSLRYSATHRYSPNLIYRLSPVEAYHQGLVKKIEVTGVDALDNLGDMQLALEDVQTSPFRAKVRTLVIRDGKSIIDTITLKQGDDLHKHTNRDEHKGGFKVNEISVIGEQPTLQFENGHTLHLGGAIAPLRTEIFRAQIRETIIEHLNRQEKLRPHGIKVLSLFFIDRVGNYTADDGIIKKLFDENFDELKKAHKEFKDLEASQVRSAYFAKKKLKTDTGENEIALDTQSRTKEEREAEKAAFSLIMRDKEKLLGFDEKISFIFAHSALKEGWDNPNVFQICTLNETIADMKKRQEIGRGLRLCVDQTGQRVFDEDINVLTVIANDNYKDFCDTLQSEYTDDGETAPPKPSDSRKSVIERNNELFAGDDFQDFLGKLVQKTWYSINFEPKEVVEESILRLKSLTFPEPKIVITRGQFVVGSYCIRLEKIRGNVAHIGVDIKSSDGSSQSHSYPAQVGTNLKSATHDETLRDYKVMEIIDNDEEQKVIFQNSCEITKYLEIKFDVRKEQRPMVDQIKSVAEAFPVFDFIGRVMKETGLTRKTLTEIFFGLPDETQKVIFRNPEGFTNKLIEVVKEVVGKHIAVNLDFTINDEIDLDVDEMFPYIKRCPQKELIDAGEHGLYNKTQVDSEVERTFVTNCLQKQDDISVYFKFPPKFKVDLPRIIQNYNPDWGIVRQLRDSPYNFEIVIETKGGSDIGKLRFASEGWKIRCAERFFDTLGIKYRAVDGRNFDWQIFDHSLKEH